MSTEPASPLGIRFPIRDLDELIGALRELGALRQALGDPDEDARVGTASLIRFLAGTSDEPAGRAPAAQLGQPKRCPVCRQGIVIEIFVCAPAIEGYLCDGCDAFWLRREEISVSDCITLAGYLEAVGIAPGPTAYTVRGALFGS